ncbi:MAG: ATP-dependent sacrificial sulfur transferase LarE [Kiritimatiellia bacterium]
MNATYEQLKSRIAEMDGVLVAFSGGVDSSLVLAAAVDALDPRALAVTACSPSYPVREREQAVSMAKFLGARHLFIQTREDENPAYRSNPPDRCYYCKRELFTVLSEILQREGLKKILDGFNADDRADIRPGHTAGCELNVRSPLDELGITKADVRSLARGRGLPNWDQAACACLASRIPYGEEITAPRLARIGAAEEAILGMGFGTVRVRDHGRLARVELAARDLIRAMSADVRSRVIEACKRQGYAYVCLDMEGYRTGSMNEVLESPQSGESDQKSASYLSLETA